MKGEFISITKKPDFGAEAFGFFFLLLAVSMFFYSVSNGSLMAFIFSIIVVVMTIFLIQNEGIAVDFNHQLYQEYQTYLGIRVGKWKKLPPINNVLVFGYQERIVQEKRTWTPMVHQQIVYKVSIFNLDLDFELLVSKAFDEQEAFRLAQELADHFKIEVQTDIRV